MSAYEIPNLRFSAEAGGAITRRRFVTFNASEQAIQATGATDVAGVLSNEVAPGEVAEIYDGIVIVEAGAALDAGTAVMSDANAKAVAYDNTVATNVKVGYAVTTASADGVLVSVKL